MIKKEKKKTTRDAIPVREGTEEVGKDAITTDHTEKEE